MSRSNHRAKVLLKARPTDEQLANRMETSPGEGLELYLACEDIDGDNWLNDILFRIDRYSLPDDYPFVVEGPLRSLDGSFFDLTADTPANRETLNRVLYVAAALEAPAVVIHAIAPREPAAYDGLPEVDYGPVREQALEQALPLLRYYARICTDHGIVPTIENIPPVARMREGTAMCSLIGTDAADMVWLCDSVEGVKITLDISHAQLYINAVNADPSSLDADLRSYLAWLRHLRTVESLSQYAAAVDNRLFECHISNARGILGEGLPYAEGDIDIDGFVKSVARRVRYFVTETIEPDPDRCDLMIYARSRITAALESQEVDHVKA